MSENILIVTRTCITCRNEPEWKPCEPTRSTMQGYCKGVWHSSIRKLVFLKGQEATYEGETITNCLAWEPKVIIEK